MSVQVTRVWKMNCMAAQTPHCQPLTNDHNTESNSVVGGNGLLTPGRQCGRQSQPRVAPPGLVEVTAGPRGGEGGRGGLGARDTKNVPREAYGEPGAGPEAWGQARALPGQSARTLWHSSSPSAAAPQGRPQTGGLGGWKGRVRPPASAPFPAAPGPHSLFMRSRSAVASVWASLSSVGTRGSSACSAPVMLPMRLRSCRL